MNIQRIATLMLASVVSCGGAKEVPPTPGAVSPTTSAAPSAKSGGADGAQASAETASNVPLSGLASKKDRTAGVAGRPIAARSKRDSIRGIVALAGPAPTPIVSLILKDGSSVRLVSSHPLATIRQLEGLEIVVYAKPRGRPDEPVDMEDFAVRAVGDDLAVDGILRRAPNGDILETNDGRRLTVHRLPDYVHDADGKRVWIAGPLDAPTSAGVIDPNRRYRFPE